MKDTDQRGKEVHTGEDISLAAPDACHMSARKNEVGYRLLIEDLSP